MLRGQACHCSADQNCKKAWLADELSARWMSDSWISALAGGAACGAMVRSPTSLALSPLPPPQPMTAPHNTAIALAASAR